MKSSGEVRKGLLRRAPVEGAHGKTIVLFIPNRKLSLEVIKGIELVRGIEVFVVLAVAPLDLPVVSGSEDPDSFMSNTEFLQRSLEVSWRRTA